MAKLIWTNNAKEDLKEIYYYIAKDSIYYANSFVRKIQHSTKKLKIYSKIGRVVPEYKNNSLRELIYYNYRIVYKIIQDNVYILTVVHSSRDFNRVDLKDWDIL